MTMYQRAHYQPSLDKDIPIKIDGASSPYSEIDDHSSTDDIELCTIDLDKTSGKTLSFNHANFPWRNISILDDDGKPLYFAEISVFTPNKPDITLHSRTENRPVVGQAHFRWSLSIKAGVGAEDASMCWTNMKRRGVLRRHYTFEYQGKTYVLRRTHAACNGVAPHQKVMLSHMKIVDEESGEVIAVYISTLSMKRKRGTLTFAKDIGQELEVLCILGFASWREKIARCVGRSSGSAGGWS